MREQTGIVIFDIDDTMYEYLPCHEHALYSVAEKFQNLYNIDKKEFIKLYKIAREELKSQKLRGGSAHSRFLYIQRLLEIMGLGTRPSLVLDLEQSYWTFFISKMKPRKGLLPLFEFFKSNNYGLGVLTDLTSNIQFRKLIHLGLDSNIDFIVTSEETGVDKPDDGNFHLIMKKFKIDSSSQIFMIGDDLVKDIEPAKRLYNAKTFLLKNSDNAKKINESVDHLFRDFEELKEIFRKNYHKQ